MLLDLIFLSNRILGQNRKEDFHKIVEKIFLIVSKVMLGNNRQGSNMINPHSYSQQEHEIIDLPIMTNTP